MKVLLVSGLTMGPEVVDLREYSLDGRRLRFYRGNDDVSSSCGDLVLSVKHVRKARMLHKAMQQLYRHARFAPSIIRDLARERARKIKSRMNRKG
jgi:hypothetical protein